MQLHQVFRLFLALAVLAGSGIGIAVASTEYATTVERHRADLSGAPGMEIVVSTAEYQPGDAIDLHRHHGVEALYVIQGAMVQAPGKEPHEIPTGASLLNLRDVYHAGFTVVGDSPLKLFTVHVVDKGKRLYQYAEDQGVITDSLYAPASDLTLDTR